MQGIGVIEGYDLFGEPIKRKVLLRDTFVEPPFTVLDTKCAHWTARKAKWKSLGIRSEVGRSAVAIHAGTDDYRSIKDKEGYDNRDNYTSIFDPVLCELVYKWFNIEGGKILDPFAGGSVRGIVAGYLGYRYTGIELRSEQVESNREQAEEILNDKDDVKPTLICGDSNTVLDSIGDGYDLVFTCPPYANLEVYSNLPEDLSNMDYEHFGKVYASIIRKSSSKLKKGGYAVIVVGEIRRKDDSDGAYLGPVPMTIQYFMEAGMKFYNEAILLNPVASASMRAAGNMKTRKLVKIHQNVLVFKKC